MAITADLSVSCSHFHSACYFALAFYFPRHIHGSDKVALDFHRAAHCVDPLGASGEVLRHWRDVVGDRT